MMECNYDEDLNQNSFFQALQTDHQDLFQKATLEGWVICVPRVGALPKYPLGDEDFLSHILIPSDELPESHFCSLTDKLVKVLDRVITIQGEDGQIFSTSILFEETCYTDELYKYKVLCLENILEAHSCSGHSVSQSLISLGSLRDCIEFLWAESSGQPVLEKLDESVQGFLSSQPDLEEQTLDNQVDLFKGLYEHCLRNTLIDERLATQVKNNRHLKQNVMIAVEAYVQHGIYKCLIKGITAATANNDAKLNKIIRNAMDLQLKDLGVRRELYENIPSAKQELAKIDGYSTVLGKVACIQKALLTLSGPTSGQVISADDFLPILIFLVVKVSMPNWIAHLTMMKDFNFSDQDENLNSFLVTSLEAALEHIRSDRLFEPLCPEALLEEDVNQEVENLERSSLEFLFHNIQADNLTRVQELLTPSNLLDELSTESLCHPLCDCDKCETELSRQKTSLSVNLSSTNNKGLTALHVASKLGRLQIAEFLLEIGSQVTSKDMHGNTPLHYTALGGHQQLMLLLLNSRASPNCMDNNGNTPLHLAALNGHETCVKALIYFCEHIGRPINVTMPNSSGDTPLHHAAKWGFEGIVHILLEAGARPNMKNNRKASPMDSAHSVHISKLLSVAPIQTKGGFQKRLSFIKMKIAAASKLPLDLLDMSYGSSPLSSPSRSRENLLEYGTKPLSIHQSKKVDKLLKAISVSDVRLACYYLGIEGSVAPFASANQPPCHPLCGCAKCKFRERTPSMCEWEMVEHRDVSEDLLDANVCNSEGITPLHAAAYSGCAELIPLLICAGASVNIRSLGRGSTPLHIASQGKKLAAVSALLDVPLCDVNVQDSRGNTPLHYAAILGCAPITEMILARTPNLLFRNSEGKTALEEAEEKMALRVVQLLKGELFES